MASLQTAVNASHVLLVEGEADRGFFEQICKSLALNPDIRVALPKDYENYFRNGKPNALKLLEDLLNELLDEEAPIKCLAIIVDADYKDRGHPPELTGYLKTLQDVKKIAESHDFTLPIEQTNGLIFKHLDGTAKFGLWIMPNNQNEGMLEDFVKTCIKTEEQPLFSHAVSTVQEIPEQKFKSHHLAKAEVATWLAWQKEPGHGLYTSVKDSLLDENNDLFQQLSTWLKHIYS